MPKPFNIVLKRPTHWIPHEPHHLAISVHELRQVMRLYMTFSDCDVFECLTHETPETKVEEASQPHPAIFTPTPDPRPSIPMADEPATLTTAPTGLADEPAVTTTLLEAANNMERAKG